LFLKPDEIGLFSQDLVSPHFAVGLTDVQTVIFYQLSADACPHQGENNECTIYDSRPIICRAFPAKYTRRTKWTLSEKCPVVSEKMKDMEHYVLTGSIAEMRAIPELDAAERLWWYRKNQLEQHVGFQVWVFDLDLQEWMPIGRVQDTLNSV